MDYLLIDIGNSRIKFAFGDENLFNIHNFKSMNYSGNEFKLMFKKISASFSKYRFGIAGISVQDEEKKSFLNEFFKKKFKLTPLFISRNTKTNFRIDYAQTLGNDRICNAAAACGIYGNRNMLITDFGTATTFTLLSGGVLKGGLILPGLKTSLDSLTFKTKLPSVKLIFPEKLYYNNTPDNIRAGVVYQTYYSVREIIKEFRKSFKGLFVIATGGYADNLFAGMEGINAIDKHLTLKGINIILRQ